MKILLVYVAPTPRGSSATIAINLKTELKKDIELLNLAESNSSDKIIGFDIMLFVAATYGDQELNDGLEEFIVSLPDSLPNMNYAVCEIGNYYGYDDFELGAGKIVESHMTKLGAKQILPMYSVDTLPILDSRKLAKWVNELNVVLS